MSIWKGERVVKGLMGYREWDPSKDENYTHVIMTEQEFDEAVKHTEAAEWLLEDAKKKFRHLSNTEHRHDQLLQDYNELQDQLDECKEELQRYKGLYNSECYKNKNLIRISRERANAARNIHPKKDSLGYIVLSVAQQTYRYKEGKTLHEEQFWKATVQTPWDASIPYNSAMRSVSDDKYGVFQPLGFEALYPSLPKKWKDINHKFAFDVRFRVNTVKGYWEVDFWTPDPIDIPAEMLPQK